ncbi:MAG: diguanylate cyclase domain-containing protein [Solirubrobacteraceae bacterium]
MRIPIQAKLLAAFGAVVGLMVTLGLFAVARLGSDNRHLRTLGSVVVPSTRVVGDISAQMNRYRKDQFHYVVARPADRPLSAPGSIQGDLNDDLAKIATALSTYRSSGLVEDATDRRLLQQFDTEFHRYVQLSAPFTSLADAGRTQAAANVIGTGAGDAEWDALKSTVAAWEDHKVATARAASTASRTSYHDGVRLILTLLAAALLAAVVIAVLLARKTTRAVRAVGAAATAIAKGDIDQHVAVRGRDELAQMAVDFDSMIDYLRTTVGVAQAIAGGNLDVDITPRSDHDTLGHALAAMTESLRHAKEDNERLMAQTYSEAHTDALTGLGNRRALMRDLEAQLADHRDKRELVLALFDLDGFKEYNDTFGHPTGDALLGRMGERLRHALQHHGSAYRMGGDEFCTLARVAPAQADDVVARAAAALSESGEAFSIGCSYGVARLPNEASTSAEALRVADDRMYEHKDSRVSPSRQTTDVLLRVLGERSPDLPDHVGEVATLAVKTARLLGLPDSEVKRIRIAAELHDIGKIAIPETILNKPGPLDDEEWNFMRSHTEIGERIIAAAPSLASSAPLVRSSHERHDGTGYPDRLAGDQIAIGASIIAVCDAFDAMTSTRSYSAAVTIAEAVAELKRCSGTQFRPGVVVAFSQLIEQPAGELDQAA